MLNVVEFADFENARELLKDKKTVLVGGCFDVLHFGHVEFLKLAKEAGNFLIVALESDEFINKNKQRRPVHTQEERAVILSTIRYVDLVIKLPYFADSKEYFDLVKTVSPKMIAVTEGDPHIDSKKKQAADVGAEVRVVTPQVKEFSTSKIISHATISGN